MNRGAIRPLKAYREVYKMSEKQLESLYNMPRIQSMIDKDLKEYGYLRRVTLKCLGNSNIILDKNFKAKAAK